MDDADSRVGSRFGPYELRSLLGRGGMGEVYEAYDTVKGRVVAVKLLPPDMAKDPVFQQRFRYESKAAARLAEPHVIPIHDWGEIDDVLYIDMRLVRGSDLRSVLRETGPLTPVRAVAIIEQIAAALDAAHAEGLVHRDVKPANILVTPSDFAYLADFGIARSAGDPSMTDTGTAVGSYNYIAPERFDIAPVSGAADVYSLACVLYECLTGTQPFPADGMSVLIRSHLTTPPPRPSVKHPGLPPAMDEVVVRGMAKEPADRYPSASALASAARAAVTAPPPPDSQGVRRDPAAAAPVTVVFPAVEPGSEYGDARAADPTTRRIVGAREPRPSSRPSGRGASSRPGPGGSGSVPGPSIAREPTPSGPVDPVARAAAPTVDLGAVAPENRPAAATPGGRAAESNPRLVAPASAGPAVATPPASGPAASGATPQSSGPAQASAASAATVDFTALARDRRSATPVGPHGTGSAEPATVDLGESSAKSGPGPSGPGRGMRAGITGPPRSPVRSTPTRTSGPTPGERHATSARSAPPTTRIGRVEDVAVTVERSALAHPVPPARTDAAGNGISPRVYVSAALLVIVVVAAGLIGWQMRGGGAESPAREVSTATVPLPDGANTCPQTKPRVGRLSASATGSRVTSCPFAEAVREVYGESAGDAVEGDHRTVTAVSPVNEREYTMDCTVGPDYVTCTGGENAIVYLF
ncbi:protein kinase [Nocardia sp. NPDC005366]|uniref:serine/threonine-protein kinase n=1 Tax=Nocardia sp. NPDC005366 TaxID=3156878 RepID=UPI0033A6C641